MYVDGCVDLLEKAIPWLLETDEQKKASSSRPFFARFHTLTTPLKFQKDLWKTFSKNNLEPFLDRYGRFLHKNPSGFFVGNEVSSSFALFDSFFTIIKYSI